MENLGIYKAIAGVMEDVGAVKKNGINKSQGFKFRGIDDVMNALHPAMVKNKVFVVPEILEQEREKKTLKSGTEMIFSLCKIKYTFFAEDGSFVEAVVIGEGMDTGDKATNKAMSIAFKYACFQVFCIPTEEMIDPDAERPEMEEKQGEKPVSRGKKADAKPKKEESGGAEAPEGEQRITKEMLAVITKECDRTGVEQKTIFGLFKVKKLEELTVLQFKKLMKKFEATPDRKDGTNE